MNTVNQYSGKIVQTKLGEGHTKDKEKLINGKVPVYLHDGRRVLCNPEKIKILGFYD